MYPSQPSPYSYQPSATSAPPQPGYISPSDSRRALEDEKEKQLQPQRQSLPSIHEALRNDSPLPYPAPPTSAPPPQANPAPPHALVGRSAGEGPAGPPNPFSNGAPAGPYMREPAYSQLQTEASRSSLTSITTQESRNPSLQSLNSSKSPTHSAKTGLTSITGSQTGSGYEYSAPTSAGSIASPNGYTSYSQPFTFQSQPPPNAPTYPPAHHDTRPYAGAPWKPGAPEPPRVEELKNGLAGRPAVPVQPQGDSAKRHLDIYEVETSLNEIAEVSTRTLDFSRHYATRAHQTQRSGPMLGSLPSLHEIEDMINLQRRNQDALMRIRNSVLNQEHALAEQMAQRKAFNAGGVHDNDHMAMYQEDFKGNGGFAGPDTKKRRGRVSVFSIVFQSVISSRLDREYGHANQASLQKAAPPGRCHSCNRAETPEWRRGPDGARTLCNACGLHYAKLTRKMGASKAASLGSNLKPKAALDSAPPGTR
ncbi:hypothetical protein CDV55_101405 [Aspergillus turcosus]|uniref:GATA-type domain-containing protein n=1 Tax=Aspergillus turcosus TaxID=1245748 RepID=A0A397HNK1_9EURO|nr:hypothetical protein CDV55_101405 [Aspergillus turcosus]RLL97613.1 hypothetical protein CFD26_101567 [Aspergillus turcosus]